MGTPHQGGDGVPLARIMLGVLSTTSYTNPILLDQIGKHSRWLQDLQARYNAVLRALKLFSSMKPTRCPSLCSVAC